LPRALQAIAGSRRLTTIENEPYLSLTGKESVVEFEKGRAFRPGFWNVKARKNHAAAAGFVAAMLF
jgi:hypothetical protein